jgi:hypothetical protein
MEGPIALPLDVPLLHWAIDETNRNHGISF